MGIVNCVVATMVGHIDAGETTSRNEGMLVVVTDGGRDGLELGERVTVSEGFQLGGRGEDDGVDDGMDVVVVEVGEVDGTTRVVVVVVGALVLVSSFHSGIGTAFQRLSK